MDDMALLAGPESRRISGGISRSTQDRLIKLGDYPAPVVLSRTKKGHPCRVAWVEADVRAWVARKIEQSRGEAA